MNAIIIAIIAAVLSGMGTAISAGLIENKKEKARRQEREQDQLKIELRDLKIQLYQLEKDLTDWKDRYYTTLQELIGVKAELEETLVRLSIINDSISPIDASE